MPEGDPAATTTTVVTPTATTQAAPAAQQTTHSDPELPDDEPMTTRTFSRLRNSYRALQDEHKALRAKATDLEATSAQVNTLRTQLVQQAVVNQAHGLFIDPEDAARYLDLEKIRVGADGKIDTKAIREQLEKVVEAKPHLKAGAGGGISATRSLPGGGTPRTASGAGAPTARDLVNQSIRRAAGVASD